MVPDGSQASQRDALVQYMASAGRSSDRDAISLSKALHRLVLQFVLFSTCGRLRVRCQEIVRTRRCPRGVVVVAWLCFLARPVSVGSAPLGRRTRLGRQRCCCIQRLSFAGSAPAGEGCVDFLPERFRCARCCSLTLSACGLSLWSRGIDFNSFVSQRCAFGFAPVHGQPRVDGSHWRACHDVLRSCDAPHCVVVLFVRGVAGCGRQIWPQRQCCCG